MKQRLKNLGTSLKNNLFMALVNKRGLSHLVEVGIVIIIVIVLALVIFFPQISSWFQDTFMAGVTEKTEELFNFTA